MRLGYNIYNQSHCRAKKQTIDGECYDSLFEASYAQELKLKQRAGKISGFTPHPKVDLVVCGYKVCAYTPDFLVEHLDGLMEYVECKGYPTPLFRLRYKLFYALYADKTSIKITMVQQGDFNILTPKKIKK